MMRSLIGSAESRVDAVEVVVCTGINAIVVVVVGCFEVGCHQRSVGFDCNTRDNG